jgi:uncharacterized membrane protein
MQIAQNPMRRRDAWTTAVFVCLCLALILIPTGFERAAPENSHHARARVLSADNSDVRQNLLVKTGTQELRVRLLDGPYKGGTATVYNSLQGKMELDEIYRKGNTILVEYSTREGRLHRAYARGKFRIGVELMLLFLFAILLVAVGGWTGAKALLSFFFAALMLWKVMVPMFLKGKDPIWVALLVVAALTASISLLVGGVSRKGCVTFLGAFMGLLLTCVLALVFSEGFRVHGAVRPFAETLLYSGFYHLNLTRIFLAGIFVASSGAVMDLAMDIASSMHEVKENHPGISVREHIRSGLAVGRAVIGTMTTTLLLAYSGSYIAMLMLFMGQGVPLVNIFNLNYVAAEVLNTLVGSFGLVTVAPFTALVGGLVYARSDPRPAQRA